MSGEAKPVRPTRVCMTNLDLRVPPITESLSEHDHDLIVEAQRLPEAHAAGGVERVVTLKDRVWFKVKTGRWRGVATRLLEADHADAGPQVRAAPWWMGAAGFRREGDPADFYEALAGAVKREGGSSEKWLPADWDWKRLELEHAAAWEVEIRRIVCDLIARSLRSGHVYQAEFHNYSVRAWARANDGETYLVIGAENVADPKVFAVIINAIPDVDLSSWMPEPNGVVGLNPGPGEIIWSTILPPAVAARLLDGYPGD
ncbi:hypothetical protein [Solwaraspora sp. WMMA2065]|uniref:hypothetical protein n=1 Tax=Solwaraspora sp. WMMA2065 TaxID=3015166 RepID=UPI00259B96CB|nr:hypothetical protein [Solwaraspora sp. WMMA2065]WJK33362.1 hypothetical protein O7610_22095 [Solwaraspora sp. WMMA2065]